MDAEDSPQQLQPPQSTQSPLPLQPPQPVQPPQTTQSLQLPQRPRPHGRGPKRTIHHSLFVPMPQTQRLDGQPHEDPPVDPNLPDFDYTIEDIHDPNVQILVDRHDRYVITTHGNGFLPNRLATEAITSVIEAKYQKPWLNWSEIKSEGRNNVDEPKPRDEFWNLFKVKCTWKKEDDSKISKAFDTACSSHLSSMLSSARNKRNSNNERIRPHWIGEGTWPELCQKWDKPEYQSKCQKAKDNKLSAKGITSTHSGGSVNAGTSSFRYKAQHGRLPTILETFDHFHCKDGEPLDSISRNISTTMKEFAESFKRQQDSLAPSERADHTVVAQILNAKFIEIAGGKHNGRVIGTGSNSSLYQMGPSGSFIDTSCNSYGSTGRSSRRQDDPVYIEVEQLRAENATLRAQQEDLLRSQQEMERSQKEMERSQKELESRVVELVQRTMQEQQRRPRGDMSQHGPYDHEITPHYDDLGTPMNRYRMPQPNNRPRLDSTVGNVHASSSARHVFNADFDIADNESFLGAMQNLQNTARGGNRSERAPGGRLGLNFPEYYDN